MPPGTATPAPPPGLPQELDPTRRGYVFIQTKSGKTRCQLTLTEVGCEAQFTNAPVLEGGLRANGIIVTADGAMRFIVGNLGDIPAITLDYRTYLANGWSIAATAEGTRFTNDRTGHGMFVSIDRVEVF